LRLALALLAALAVGGGTTDLVLLRPHHAPAARVPARGALVTAVLADGTMLISRTDWQGGTYPIGRRFVPALP
jgi:hypothetical protein